VGRTYLPGDRWSNIEGQIGFLRPWAEWRRADPDRLFALNVPMLERNEARLSDAQVRTLLRAGARGAYHHHFRTLAQRLVALGLEDTVVVLGWEMNGTTYTHRCGPDPAAWKAYWRGIVTTMRAVPGQRFRFDWAPNRGVDALGWVHCYPGDDVVDIIGLDTYDQTPGRTFDDHVRQPYGLQDHVDFAAARGKPISFPEWGLFRNGDNAEYMRRMLDWIAEHEPVYHSISDYCPHGVWRCPSNPNSAALFREAQEARDALEIQRSRLEQLAAELERANEELIHRTFGQRVTQKLQHAPHAQRTPTARSPPMAGTRRLRPAFRPT
jgi:hypothetical protein